MFERHGMVGDISPVGVAANMHLSVSSGNFGIQEYTPVNEALQEVFTGCVQVKDGFAYVSDKPGLGIELDEHKAKAWPINGGIRAGH